MQEGGTMGDPNICPNCPYVSFIPLIKAEQVSYTKQKEEFTAIKLCQKMRQETAFVQADKQALRRMQRKT